MESLTRNGRTQRRIYPLHSLSGWCRLKGELDRMWKAFATACSNPWESMLALAILQNKFDNKRSKAINNVVKEEGRRKGTNQIHIHKLIEERVTGWRSKRWADKGYCLHGRIAFTYLLLYKSTSYITWPPIFKVKIEFLIPSGKPSEIHTMCIKSDVQSHGWFWLAHFEAKPSTISQQCLVYKCKCDLCDTEYVGYTSRHLHQRIDEHRYSAISKHFKNDHGLETIGLTSNFSVLKKCNWKLDCLIYEMFFIKKIRPCLNTQLDSIRAKQFI